jgi:hypothetical protein
MTQQNITRRNAIVAIPVTAAGITLAGCEALTAAGLNPATLALIISGVQQAIATVCALSGAVVPTANSILALVNQVIATLGGKQIAASDLIDTVVKQIQSTLQCPQPAASGERRTLGTPAAMQVNGIDVQFINFAK